MMKLKETINAITGGNFPAAIRISRKEHTPIPINGIEPIIKRISHTAIAAFAAYVIVNIEMEKLLALLVFATFALIIRFADE